MAKRIKALDDAGKLAAHQLRDLDSVVKRVNSRSVKLSPAQDRMLRDLYPHAENSERMWYFRTQRARTTLVCLHESGLVDLWKDGFTTGARLTKAGLQYLGVDDE